MDLPWGFYLGWDWPWIIFFIALGLSLMLASVMKNWRVLWVLPALVLYSGLTWALPGGWSLLFVLGFWVCLLVAVVTAVLPGPTRLARVPFYLMATLVVWCLVLWVFSGIGWLPGWDLLWKILLVAFLVALVLRLFMTKIGTILLALVVFLAIINLALGLLFGGQVEKGSDQPSDACLTFSGKYDPEVQTEVPEVYVRDEAKDCTK